MPRPAEKLAPSREVPRSDVGYVAAFLLVEHSADTFKFGLVDPYGESYELAAVPADAAIRPPGPSSNAARGVRMIPLPPGDYQVTYWRHAGPWPRAILDRRFTRPFAVRPGHVVFLGAFSANVENVGVGSTRWEVDLLALPADRAWATFTEAYPAFTSAPIECLLCTAPDGAPSAAPALPESGGFSRAPDIVIHLVLQGPRAGCRLLAWETFDDKRGRRRVPDGSAVFEETGVAFRLRSGQFRNRRVQFEVAKCELSSRIAGSWDLERGLEVWLRERDPTIHFSREDAGLPPDLAPAPDAGSVQGPPSDSTPDLDSPASP